MFTKKFFLHLLAAVVITVVVIWIVLSMLASYTRHGEVFIVPDFTGQDHEMVIHQYSDQFSFIVSDSLYKQGAVLGSVLQQEPPAGSKVKRGRNIYLMTVAKQPEKVIMPNIQNLSLREALVTLASAGLEVGEIQVTPHFARNAIVAQKYHGTEIEPGTQVYRGVAIDLVVGDGGSIKDVAFPMIYGKNAAEAKQLLHSLALNVGKEIFPADTDINSALVFKVEPYYRPGAMVSPGSYVNLIYKPFGLTEISKYLRDSLYLESTDTTNVLPEDEI